MTRSLRGTALALVAAIGMAGCGDMYGAKAEPIPKPHKKAKPPVVDTPAADIKYDEDCKTKFQEDNKTAMARRSPGRAAPLIDAGDASLASIGEKTDPAAAASAAVDAINRYKNALAQDPYSARATYQLAVAYALVRKKGCALALLKRLTDLQKYPDFENEATRMMHSVDDEPAFKGFHKDALAAAGQ